jgi:hypothetical protein
MTDQQASPPLTRENSSVEEPHLRVSATLYTTWKKCPAQAAARLAGHYPADTINSFKGLLAHRIFAHHLNTGPISPSQFTRTCRTEIGSSNLNYKVRQLALKPSQITRTIAEIADLYRRFTQINPHGQPEVHLEYQLTEAVTLIGTIDCAQDADPHVRLIDWKTGELGDAADQLAFYALVYWLARSQMPMQVEAVSVSTGERYEAWVDRGGLDRSLLEVTEMVADLTTGAVAPTPGPWCRWCPILTDCEPGQRTVATLEGEVGYRAAIHALRGEVTR